MNATTKLGMIRDFVNAKVLELQPFASEEMNLPQTDPHYDGFVDGERTMALQILSMIDEDKVDSEDETKSMTEPTEEEMVLSLGQT